MPISMRAPAIMTLTLAGLACLEPGSEFRHCDRAECTEPPCEEGTSNCLDDRRAALCREGKWVERACALGCTDDRCVDCIDGESRCVDPQTAAHCQGGVF